MKMGQNDLQLFKKCKNGGKWEQVSLPEAELPPVDLGMFGSPSRTLSTSPAPGRPSQNRPDKRCRESTGSSNGSNPKTARKESERGGGDDEENDAAKGWTNTLKEANLVTDTAMVSPVKD